MATKLLKVTLNANGNLDVNDAGGLSVSPVSGGQLIVWSLSGAALQDAEFADPGSGSGFTWIDTPVGIFSQPMRSANGRRLVMDDDHWGAATAGSWIYMLRVAVWGPEDTVAFHTTTVSRTKAGVYMSTNPVIINR